MLRVASSTTLCCAKTAANTGLSIAFKQHQILDKKELNYIAGVLSTASNTHLPLHSLHLPHSHCCCYS